MNINKIELLLITLYLTVRLITIKNNHWSNVSSL